MELKDIRQKINEIDKEMARRNSYQGIKYKKED